MLTEKYFHNHGPELNAYFEVKSINFLSTIKTNIFLIEINGKKYILKIYPKDSDRNRITFFENLQNFTSKRLDIKPTIQPATDGNLNIVVAGDVWELCNYEENVQFNPETKSIDKVFYETGFFLGSVHRSFEEFEARNISIPHSVLLDFPNSPDNIEELLSEYRSLGIPSQWQEILQEKIKLVNKLKESLDLSVIPQGIVHGDIYPKNLLYDSNMNIIGLIDYAQAGLYYRCYEVIRAIIQTNKYLGFTDLKPEHLSNFLAGYSENIHLTDEEVSSMLKLYLFIQASDISFFKPEIIQGTDNGLKEYALFRSNSLKSLVKDSEKLNNIIYSRTWNKK